MDVSTPERRASNQQAERMKERLDEFEDDIRKVREELQELEHTDHQARFYDSGDTPNEDDQTIVPPG